NRGAEDQPPGADHLGLLHRRQAGTFRPGAPRDHGSQVEIPPREGSLYGPRADDLRRGRSPLTSSTFYPNLFPFPSHPLTVGTRRPRVRYIAFRVDGPRSYRREEIAEALRPVSPRLRLAVFDGTMGLARTTNLEKDL